MGKIFNNEAQKAITTITGWGRTLEYDGDRIANILDTVGAGVALEKMGTSIPSPFARMILFNTAFDQVNALGADQNNIYNKLVSECLDFIEFLYRYGDKVQVKEWNVKSQIGSLNNSTYKGHNRLGDTLEKFIRDIDVKSIYLFYYNGVLIGGSSPYTLVYTSPNWHRNMNVAAKGMSGNTLFDNYASQLVEPVPLYKRDKKFREYLTKYIIAFSGVPRFTSSAFRTYIFKNQDGNLDPEMNAIYANNTGNPAYSIGDFINEYHVLNDNNGVAIDIYGLGGANILYIASDRSVIEPVHPVNDGGDNDIRTNLPTDYMIKATVKRYGSLPKPLVLNDGGVGGALYVGNRPWERGTLLTRNSAEPLNQRILPGGSNVKYPYLTDADFLEDKLISMNYDINSKGFKTFNSIERFLLPLKPRFFEYFNVDDINQTKGLSLKMEKNQGKVIVTLSVPIECSRQGYIELKKEYQPDDILVLKANESFAVDIFPSYRLKGDVVPNIYSVLEYDNSREKSLHTEYFKITPNAVERIDVRDTARESRSETANYVEIDDAFDFITVEWQGAKAMIIPNFKQVEPNKSGDKTKVGIDFGTSNTYVALSYNDGAAPETLKIDEDDLQVLTLNKIDVSDGTSSDKYMDSFPGMLDYNSSFDREYAPLIFGVRKNKSKEEPGFPYRTVTCEVSNFTNVRDPKLFGHINIGFNFLKELGDIDDVVYRCDIKWGLSNNEGNTLAKENRVQAFCTEVAWLIKNKVMLGSKPSSTFTVYITFPHTMKRNLKTQIEGFWKNAFNRLMGQGNVTIKRVTESQAPYYFMIGEGASITENAVNIDVGGGTTDILFADAKKKIFFYDSSLFAGNDIWGDGKRLVMSPKQFANGFVTFFENSLNAGVMPVTDQMKDAYENYKKLVDYSEDVMNYIFSYDDDFKFSKLITNEERLKRVLVIHLASIIYHVAKVLVKKGMDMPQTITFSGMGSKYINLISPNTAEDITPLIRAMLETFVNIGRPESDRISLPRAFKVKFQESPKVVTAQGAILLEYKSLDRIRDFDNEEVCVYGVEGAPEVITYDEVNQYKDGAIKALDEFLDTMKNSRAIRNMLRELDIRLPEDLFKTIRDQAQVSFDVMAQEGDSNDEVNETLFFWTLKNGIYEATKLP